ncbi:hypothetical protein [Azospirillum endophyticum]
MGNGGCGAGSVGSTRQTGPVRVRIAQRPAARHILTVCV